MDKHHQKQAAKTRNSSSEEVSSVKWEFINMSEEEEDLINRMYRLVGDRDGWMPGQGLSPLNYPDAIEPFLSEQANTVDCLLKWDLIAGRIPGRKPEEIERFWIMKHAKAFAEERIQHSLKKS